MKLIKLTQGKFAQVDDEDFEQLNKLRWTLNTVNVDGCIKLYAKRNDRIGGKQRQITMHRLIMGCIIGDGKMIDHKDGDGLNNQKHNLRFCTPAQNQQNKACKSISGYLGVYKNGKAWYSKIRANGNVVYLGYFKDKESAAIAYNKAAILYYGEHSRLNAIT